MSSYIPNILVQSFHSARDYFTPVLTTSQFIEKGQITPEEFVVAGDYLVRMSPGWKWVRGDTERLKAYLPSDKQYLMMRNITCHTRVKHIESEHELHTNNIIMDPTFEDISTRLPPSPSTTVSDTSSEDSEEYGDLMTTPLPPPIETAAIKKDETRFYELTIVYDNYYRTPRIFLRGETHTGIPLGPCEIMEDIMQDYVNKTATLESHPHTGLPYISIHPCRHAQTMKRIIDTISSPPSVQLYMFIFLKFIGSMIPTLDYDLSMPITIA
jgi:ubiquitin-like-conjugating enzyme ATG3